MNKKYASALAATAMVATSLFALPALAETTAPEITTKPPMGQMGPKRGIPARSLVGTVASVNGTTLTITVKTPPRKEDNETKTPITLTYTVDASKAVVMKAGSKSAATELSVGDMVMVMGTINGTTITAERIMEGFPKETRAEMKDKMDEKRAEKMEMKDPAFSGDGQPIVIGNVSAISGTTITLTNKSGATYTIDAASAKVEEAGSEATLANVVVGDMIIVQGTVNGTSITASSIIDQKIRIPEQAEAKMEGPAVKKGILGNIGGFFTRLFGF